MADKHAVINNLNSLLGKFSDPDPDIRYMSLNDLFQLLSSPPAAHLSADSFACSKAVEGLLKTLEDQNGEVQNQALKCISPLAIRLPADSLTKFIENLSNLTSSPTIDTSVPNTALRILVTSIPHPDAKTASNPTLHTGYNVISTVLIPRLVGSKSAKGMLAYDSAQGYSSDAIDVLIETVKLYGSILRPAELEALQGTVRAIIENNNAGTVVIKRALTAMSILASHLSDDQLSSLVSNLIESFRSPHLTIAQRRHLIATIGALAKAIPGTFGPYLKTLAPFVLSPVGEQEMAEMRDDESDSGEHDPKEDELRETAFVTLDTLLMYCPAEMQNYLSDTIAAALRYLKFDPNVADDDEEMGGTQEESSDDGVTEEADDDDQFDDFEEDEEGYSDIDDMSWKVRRCAAKVLHTAVVTQARGTDDASIYQHVVPPLLARFNKEREESVKLEVLISVTGLVKKASEGSAVDPDGLFAESAGQARTSRKRRRQDSDLGDFNFETDLPVKTGQYSPPAVPTTPTTGPQGEIARLTPTMIQGLVKLWKKASIPLKQAAILLLRSLALVRYGGLADYLQQIEDPIADALKISGTGGISVGAAGTVGAGGLQIESLSLLSAICGTHASNSLVPFLIALIPQVVSCVNDKNYKVSGEALGTIEQIAKALTPPRFSSDNQDLGPQLEMLYSVVIERISDNGADLEVRQRAIRVLGILLGRTSGPQGSKLIGPANRSKGLGILVDRLKNETTRLAAARAIDDIATFACSDADVTTAWISEVTIELGGQLRKSDRALRGSCLEALKNLSINTHTRAQFDKRTIQALTSFLLPLLNAEDLHLLTPALIVFSKIIPTDPQALVDNRLISALCSVVRAPLASTGTALKAFLFLVRIIGEQAAGAPLMHAFLQDVGVSGEPGVVGRAIGTLLVHGGPNIGVKTQDFLNELQQTADNQRKCLALAILGEVGLRMGSDSGLDPHLFIAHFNSKSDKVRLAAAVALGNAGANNIEAYVPVILQGLDTSSSSRYLLLHSLKEILQHPESVRADVAPFATRLWEILLAASDDEDNRAVGAECIGKLALIDPASYIPLLQKYLEHSNAAVRGTVISAFRYTLSDSSAAYNDVLRPLIMQVLTTMLSDQELANHRLALTTVNSAIHNKPSLVLPYIGQLLPTIFADAHIKPQYIREVQMGPFKHKVDDGLEMRKSAYETLYTCLDLAFSSLSIPSLFSRLEAGISDEPDIRTLSTLMLSKLIALAPADVEARLDTFCPAFTKILTFKPKENAVKQEVDKADEARTSVLKMTVELRRAFPGAEAGGERGAWREYLDVVGKGWRGEIKELEGR